MADDQYLTDLRNRHAILAESGEPNRAAADAVQAEIDEYEASLQAKEDVPRQLDKLTKDELVALADEHDVDTSGTKAEIIERLVVSGVEPD